MKTLVARSICALLPLLAYTTTTGDADPRVACRAFCGRTASCGIMPKDLCTTWCLRQPSADDPSTYRQAKESCPKVARVMAGSKWLCTAEGATAYGHNLETSNPDTGT